MTALKITAFVAALALPLTARAELPRKPVLTLEVAKAVVAAAEAEAMRRGSTVVIVVVDDGGHVVLMERLDDTQVASVEVGIGKARTAAIFRRPSKVFEDQIRDGRVAALALPGATPLQGGVPLIVGDQVVGAIGVSGNTPQEDEDIAKAGAAALSARQPPVSYFESADVAAVFVRGGVLFDGENGRNYMVHASHRDAGGMAEVHELDADIIYVIEGMATFVTGGTAENLERSAPNELRGTSIRGGETRRLVKGDVLIVPKGTPHWFQDVKGPFNYYVVKVR